MTLIRSYILTTIICLYFSNSIFGMVFDNRYFPLYLKPYLKSNSAYMHYQFQPIFMRAEKAHGDVEQTRIPDIDGEYDMLSVYDGLITLYPKYEDILKSDLRSTSIPWKRKGILDAQGIAFYYEQFLHKNFSIGTSFLFLHYTNKQEFLLDRDDNFESRHATELFSAKSKLHKALNLTPANNSKIGFGDIDLFCKFNYTWDHIWKIRTIDTRFKIGTYIPTSNRIDIDNPASLPIGGNKHWGAYLDFTLNTELKEDWWASVMFRGIKRFKKTYTSRMPINQEPSRYGPFIGELETNPGWTLVANPYATFAGLRDGFGLQILYTLVYHWSDKLNTSTTKTVNGNSYRPELIPVINRSEWGSEYITASAFYDFSTIKNHDWLPTVSIYWDIPVDWLVARRSIKTNAISLMVQGNF